MDEETLRAYLGAAGEPRTLPELLESLVEEDVHEEEAITQVLHRLLERGEVQSRRLCNGDVVYWAPAAAGVLAAGKPRPPDSTTPAARAPLPRVRSSRKARLPFKSPARLSESASASSHDLEAVANEVLRLKKRLKDINADIAHVSADYNSDELQVFIDGLHEYNEVKDAGQLLLGKLAEQEGTTTATLYRRFGLNIED